MSSPAPLSRIRIVLCQPSHPGNIGAAARAMKTMGLTRLVLVNAHRFPDPEADARSSNATDVLHGAKLCTSLDEALADCQLAIALSARPRELSARIIAPREVAKLVVEQAQETAFVFGNETTGLSNDEVSRCQWLCSIPANPDYASLNLAAAVQVIAYELRLAAMQGDLLVAPAFPLATGEEIEHLYQHATQTLVALKFLNPLLPKRLLPRLRRLFARTQLEHEEVNILRGVLTSIDRVIERKSK